MAMIDRKVFFDEVRRSLFKGRITQDQFKGMLAILDNWDRRYPNGDFRWLAYMLATTYHETGRTMQPVREAYWKDEAWRKANFRYYPYYGRGFVQLTWKENYERAGRHLGVNLVANPDLALHLDHAAEIMFVGMVEGWFRADKRGRHTLARYFNKTVDAPKAAREIINGREPKKGGGLVADDIAAYHRSFLFALNKAAGGVALPPVTAPDPFEPEPAPMPTSDPLDPVVLPNSKPTLTSKTIVAAILTPAFAWLALKGFEIPPEARDWVVGGIVTIGGGLIALFHARSRRPVNGSPLALELDKAKESIAWNKSKLDEAAQAAEAAEAAATRDRSYIPQREPEPPEPLEQGEEFELPPRRLADVILDTSARQLLADGPDAYRILEGLMRGLASPENAPGAPAVRVLADTPTMRVTELPKQLDNASNERPTL